MEKEEKENPTPDGRRPMRIGRLEVGTNLFIQVLVWALIIGMLNFWSARHFTRFDWGRNTELELSPRTKSLLEGLQKPVHAILYFTDENPEAERLATSLLREYQFASKGKLTIETINPDADRARAQELAKKYLIEDRESLIIFDCEGRKKLVLSKELAEMQQETQQQKMSRAMSGAEEAPAHMISFNGESKITAALLDVTDPKKYKVYFLTGHGEADYNAQATPHGRSINLLKLNLDQLNIVHAPLNLAEVNRIPDDADAVLVIGPVSDFGERDLRLLSEYWDRKGRILICSGPTVVRKTRLNEWLIERGIGLRGDDVMRVDTSTGDIDRAGGLWGNSPIVRGLQNVLFLWGGSKVQSMELDLEKVKTGELSIKPFMLAPAGFWGETTPLVQGGAPPPPTPDPNTDFLPTPNTPLVLAAHVEKGGSEDPKVKLEAARLTVFGINEIFMDAQADKNDEPMQLAMGAINWLTSRETLTGIGAKPRESVNFAMAPAKLNQIGLWIIFYIPLTIAIFGLYHLRWRHGKSFFLLTAWLAGVFLALVGGYYLLLYALGEESISTMPRGLVSALIGAALSGAGALALHIVERKNRPGARS